MDMMVNTLIVPYTDAGLTRAKGVIQTVFDAAVSAGYAVADTLVINDPKISDATGNEASRGWFPPFVASFTIQAGGHRVTAIFNVSQ
jgi:hypothetical protein